MVGSLGNGEDPDVCVWRLEYPATAPGVQQTVTTNIGPWIEPIVDNSHRYGTVFSITLSKSLFLEISDFISH